MPDTETATAPNKGGRPRGIHTPLRTKKIYDPDELAEGVAAHIVQGESLRVSTKLGAVTEYDRRNLARITGESVEVFNERLAQKLRTIADKVTDRIEEKVDADEFKTGELGFILSVAHDKRLSLDGSRALNNASVNLQVHYHGTSAKTHLLGELDGLANAKRVEQEIVSLPATAETSGPAGDPQPPG